MQQCRFDYLGVTGELNFTPAGERAVDSYGILRFNAQNKIDRTPAAFAELLHAM